ncbi:nol1 nop2 sun family protein [Cyclospora cayetanensis]|uniref:Nol1 nop2 sun family protein n=1 Tax=Cyclospora cayetanensis TaxID=88456 RepID=A0A1D3CXN8_9EIME|nr:nol1 nop2 sun family protein [Cyclospora cayetanensis]
MVGEGRGVGFTVKDLLCPELYDALASSTHDIGTTITVASSPGRTTPAACASSPPSFDSQINHLLVPPRIVTLRVNRLRCPDTAVALAEAEKCLGAKGYVHPAFADILVFPRFQTLSANQPRVTSCTEHGEPSGSFQVGPSSADTPVPSIPHGSTPDTSDSPLSGYHSRTGAFRGPIVVVGPQCGQSVLRGSHVFAPGILAAERGIREGAEVSVWALPRPFRGAGPFERLRASGEAKGVILSPVGGDLVACMRPLKFLRGAYIGEKDREAVERWGVFCGRGRLVQPLKEVFMHSKGQAICMQRVVLSSTRGGGYCCTKEAENGHLIVGAIDFPRVPVAADGNGFLEAVSFFVCMRVCSAFDLSDLPASLVAQQLPSCLVGLVLSPQPGEHVLDMCAAPGHKTAHLASLMRNTGVLVALERSKKRAEDMLSLLARLGAPRVECIHADSTKDMWHCSLGEASQLKSRFDKVLADVPCTGLGLRPRIVFDDVDARSVKAAALYQRQFLSKGTELLRPGGILVYSTCSISWEENEGNVEWALKKLPLDLEPAEPFYAAAERRHEGSKVQRFCVAGDTIGFFIAKFKRRS